MWVFYREIFALISELTVCRTVVEEDLRMVRGIGGDHDDILISLAGTGAIEMVGGFHLFVRAWVFLTTMNERGGGVVSLRGRMELVVRRHLHITYAKPKKFRRAVWDWRMASQCRFY